MPEGHTIHRAALDQAPGLVGRRLSVVSPSRRYDAGAAAIDGRRLGDLDAWGKHLLYFFDGRRVLHVHLGMDGRIRPHRPAPPASRSAALRVVGPDFGFDLNTPKVCEVLDEGAARRLVARLGPDPIRVDDDGGTVLPRLAGCDGPIGVAVMDQSMVAGIGNVYRAEILFLTGIHPLRPASSITGQEWERIWAESVRLLRLGVENRGDIVTVDPRDLRVRDRRRTYAYGQRYCVGCRGPIRRWELAGRVAYACDACQPL